MLSPYRTIDRYCLGRYLEVNRVGCQAEREKWLLHIWAENKSYNIYSQVHTGHDTSYSTTVPKSPYSILFPSKLKIERVWGSKDTMTPQGSGGTDQEMAFIFPYLIL